MQNEPNFKIGEMNLSTSIIKGYDNLQAFGNRKNEPNFQRFTFLFRILVLGSFAFVSYFVFLISDFLSGLWKRGILQNEPNFKNIQMHSNQVHKTDYEQLLKFSHPKNEPKRTQFSKTPSQSKPVASIAEPSKPSFAHADSP